MSPLGKYYVGAGIASLLALWLLPSLFAWLFVVAVIGGPVAAYFMLDESQRSRLKRLRRRQIGG